MIDKLTHEISELKSLLEKRNNKASVFFDGIINQINQNKINDAVNSILTSYSIVQYADFNYEEEKLFDTIWNTANKMKEIL